MHSYLEEPEASLHQLCSSNPTDAPNSGSTGTVTSVHAYKQSKDKLKQHESVGQVMSNPHK